MITKEKIGTILSYAGSAMVIVGFLGLLTAGLYNSIKLSSAREAEVRLKVEDMNKRKAWCDSQGYMWIDGNWGKCFPIKEVKQ